MIKFKFYVAQKIKYTYALFVPAVHNKTHIPETQRMIPIDSRN